MLIDLSHPTPAFGVNNRERASFLDRAKGDVVLALALIHHLCIGKNMSFAQVAAMLAGMAPRLIIEWVPKADPKVQLLLKNRKDIYPHYTVEQFEAAFSGHFPLVQSRAVGASGRRLYLFERNA